MLLLSTPSIITGITVIWERLQKFISNFFSLFIVKAPLGKELNHAVRYYLSQNFKEISLLDNSRYYVDNIYIKNLKKFLMVLFEETHKKSILYRKGFRFIMMASERDIIFIRGSFNLEKLFSESVKYYNNAREVVTINDEKKNRFFIKYLTGRATVNYAQIKGEKKSRNSRGLHASNNYDDDAEGQPTPELKSECNLQQTHLKGQRFIDYKSSELSYEQETLKNRMKSLSYPKEVHDYIKEIEYWIKSEEWYTEKGIPWRRGWMIYGKPGTGKTSLIIAIAEYFDLPLCIFDISSMDNEEFRSSWKDTLTYHAPCIILIEDIDIKFNKRESKKRDWSVSYDCFLNTISGVECSNGIFLIITTNKENMIDEALGTLVDKKDGMSTRPGRIDRIFELKELDENCRREIAKRILGEDNPKIEIIIKESEGDTGAQFTERCSLIALKEHWKGLNLEKAA